MALPWRRELAAEKADGLLEMLLGQTHVTEFFRRHLFLLRLIPGCRTEDLSDVVEHAQEDRADVVIQVALLGHAQRMPDLAPPRSEYRSAGMMLVRLFCSV